MFKKFTIYLVHLFITLVYYLQEKDNYGNEVTKLARPLPVEYLLVDMSAAFPVEPLYTFKVADKPFPRENRHVPGEMQVRNK